MMVACLLQAAGGFIPGRNGHAKGKRHVKGCFGSTKFENAKQRGDQTRNVDRTTGVPSLQNCPVVLELRAEMASLTNYKRGSPELFCAEGRPGALLPGVAVVAVHWNKRFVANYRALGNADVQAKITRGGGIFVMLCGQGRQVHDFQSCGCHDADNFIWLGKYKVCKRCHPLWAQS